MGVSLAPEPEAFADLNEADIDYQAMRASGPGGQHVNKTASAVRLVHLATGVTAQCQDHRERLRNRVDALRALRLALALHLRGGTDPAWLDPYRRGRQLGLGANAQDYHLAVACALDALERAGGELAAAARALAVSSSQLVRLLTADKAVHQAANAMRAAQGHGPLHGR